MFPVTVTIHNLDQLRAVAAALQAEAATPEQPTPAKATPAKAKPAKAAEAAPAPTPAATPAAAGPSAAAQSFLQDKVGPTLKALCLKDYPKAEAILKSYGVERASLVPEKELPGFLAKLEAALHPEAAEQERLAQADKSLF